MESDVSAFVMGTAEVSPRRKKLLGLRVGFGFPIYPGIGAYGSPIGDVTGVGNPPTMNPEQFGGGDTPAPETGGSGTGGDSGGGDGGGGGAP